MIVSREVERSARAPVRIRPLVAFDPTSSSGAFRGGQLPEDLRQAYGGDLWIPLRAHRPTVIANFVSTLDGVVSFNVPGQAGGGEVSGFYEPDRFLMGLLRAISDAVLIGAGTLRDTPAHVWAPPYTHPPSAAAFAELRRSFGLAKQPTTVVVTGSGDVDLSRKGLSDPDVPVTIITTEAGRAALRRQAPFAAHVEVVAAGSDRVDAAAVLAVMSDRGIRLIVCEGGPHLFGQLVNAHLVDELFLTISPQLAGRAADTPRLALIEGQAFTLAGAPWTDLADLRRSDNHLFARYTFREATQ